MSDFSKYLAPHMPESEYAALTEDQQAEAVKIAKKAEKHGGMAAVTFNKIYKSLARGFESNPGLAWLAMATSLKYTVVQMVEPELAKKLMAWDFVHLDDFHSRFMGGSDREKLFDQRLSSLCAYLANQAVGEGDFRQALEDVSRDWPYDGGRQAFGDLLHDALWDKWSPETFNDAALAVLNFFFRSVNELGVATTYTRSHMDDLQQEREEEDAAYEADYGEQA